MKEMVRREFLGLAAAAVAFPMLPPSAMANKEPFCHAGLHRYAWAEALRFWPTAEAGALKAVYLTFNTAEFAGLSAPEVTELVLADVAPLVPLERVRDVSVAGGGGAQPECWTCTCTTEDKVQVVITVWKLAGMPPVLRGELCDLEVREDELILSSHDPEEGWLSFPVPEAPGVVEIAKMRQRGGEAARGVTARALGVYRGQTCLV